MKEIRISKVSRTGRSYKLNVVSFDGFLELVRTTPDDPDALSVVQKGTTSFYCPLCGDSECIKKTASTALKYAFNMYADLDRSLYREIRMCANNKDPIRNHDNIKKIVELHNREDVLKILENQSNSFYLIENFSVVLIKPPFSEKIICPSCGSRKFHSAIYPQIKSEEGRSKIVKCPACSMEFDVNGFWSSMMLIIDQLYRNIEADVLVLPPREKIKHIFINYPFAVTVKTEKERSVFNCPTDYIRLTSPIQIEELLTLFRKFSREETSTFSGNSSAKPKDPNHRIGRFHPFYQKNMARLVAETTKKEYESALTVFAFGGWPGWVFFANPPTNEIVYLRLKEEYQSWVKIFNEIISYLVESEKLEPKLPSGSFVFKSSSYPTQADSFDEWEKNSGWTQLSMNEVMISPAART